jgi:excinuclease ABC subunit C
MVEVNERLSGKVEALPRRPGVYLFKDARHEVIYVGKAKDLREAVDASGKVRYNRAIGSREGRVS